MAYWYVIDIGNGFTDYKKYIEGPYEDLYCFPTIKSNDNCIVKNYLMVINEYPYRNTHIGINDFTEYQLTQENKIERVFNPHDFKKDNFRNKPDKKIALSGTHITTSSSA